MDIVKRLTAELPEGYEWTEKELALMHLAQATADTIKQLEAELNTSPVMNPGSRNQPRINPLIVELRLQRESLAKILARIHIPDGEEKSEQHQRAALARWDKVRRHA